MLEFLSALSQYAFLQNAVGAVVLGGVACGVMGSFVVARRITYLAGGIAHSVLGGMGMAHYLSVVMGWSWLHPVHGALATALLAGLVIGWVSLRHREREDTVIGAIWAGGMATGIIFISQTPGYNQELMSYLFGNILMVSSGDLWTVLALDVIMLTVVWLAYRQFLVVCFDSQFAKVRGINIEVYYLLLLALVAITVVVLSMVVGVILVIALLTIPAAIAGRFVRTLGQSMIVGTSLAIGLSLIGLAASYQPNLPAGATIILVLAVAYLGIAILKRPR